MKIDAPAKAAPAPAPAEPISEPADDAGFGDFGGNEEPAPANDKKPFNYEPFDAGVEADEETDPKKFIQQLTGKLGESLRAYTDEQGQPDFDLEKFAINSLLSATHTAEMDEEDRKDIIKKVNTSGDDGEDNEDDSNNDSGDSDESGDEFGGDMGDLENSDEEGLQEGAFILDKDQIKRSSLFAPKGSKEAEFKHDEETLEESLWGNIADKKAEGRPPAQPGDEDYPDKKQWDKLTKEEGIDELNKSTYNNAAAAALGKGDGNLAMDFLSHSNEMGIDNTVLTLPNASSNNYMFWQNLKTIAHAATEILKMDNNNVDTLIANGHAWAVDHLATSADDVEEVYHFLEATMEYDDSLDYDGETEGGYEDEYGSVENVNMNEAEYHGKEVKLGKPSSGDVKNKKFKVYVKNKKGNVVKVNFGDANMEIKRDNPKNKKSFRARHKCSQAKDRTTPKYWSCKMWSSKPVSKIVGENLVFNEKNSTFDKNYLIMKIQETFNHDAEPMIQPQTKPKVVPSPDKVQPNIAPSRKNKPFLPMPAVTPDPKAINEGVWNNIMKGVRGGSQHGPWSIIAIDNNRVVGQDISIEIKDAIPAHYEDMKRKYPNSRLRIEDNEGRIVWESK